tara:strand:- start:6165 stop:6269 length:105 start_codon:yes stop_codon:yes gene_type:complete
MILPFTNCGRMTQAKKIAGLAPIVGRPLIERPEC